jgi:DNA-binding GntR family transcriptional regulator
MGVPDFTKLSNNKKMTARNKIKTDNNESRQIVDDLMTAIANGTFKPGQRLVEMQLCEIFNAKRSSVREALRRLEHEGFVKIIKNVGALVTEGSQKDLEEMYDLLSVLDGVAVRLATPFISSKQIEELEKLIKKMETEEKPALLAASNHEFHSLLCLYSENKRLIKLTDNLRLNISLLSFQNFFSKTQKIASVSDHRKIIEAITKNDPKKAEALMRKHVTEAKYRAIKWMNKSL